MDCYEKSATSPLLLLPGSVLVHGIPLGQGKIAGIRYGHAWIEMNGFAYDPVAGVIPLAEYYAVGQIEYTVRYTYRQAQKKMNDTGIYGPWDPAIERAVHKN